jgi:hypothetical protein
LKSEYRRIDSLPAPAVEVITSHVVLSAVVSSFYPVVAAWRLLEQLSEFWDDIFGVSDAQLAGQAPLKAAPYVS